MIEKLVKNVLDTLAGLGDSEKVALFHVLENQCAGELAGGFNTGNFIGTGKIFDFQDSPLQEVLNSKQPMTFHGQLIDDVPFPSYQETHSSFECLCLPLLGEETDVIGIAVIAQPMGITQPDYRLRTLNMLRTLIAAAMENARLFQLATTDSLTGLYVRRYFDIRLHEESVRLRRHGGTLALLLMDIDFFKQVNDTYGHPIGDDVLKDLAQLLLECTRQDFDLPCRFGGEEFIILLPQTNLEGALVLAERIRKRCEQHPFAASQLAQALRVTVSIGISTMEQATWMPTEHLIQQADEMLYAAKQAGRNQIFYPQSVSPSVS